MKPFFILSILASAAMAIPPIMDSTAYKCNLMGSGSVVCRSCPSMTCDSMASWNPGKTVNANCMCHGQMQGGSNVWLYVNNKDCYIRQPRTDCCEDCMPMCNHCPCTGNNCGGGGGGGGGNCGPNGCGGGNGGGNCGPNGCGGGGGGGGNCGPNGCGGGNGGGNCGGNGCGNGGGGNCGGGGCGGGGGGGGGCTGSHCHDGVNSTLVVEAV